MTVSSLAKKLVGVNDIVIENVELEATSVGEKIVIRGRPRKNAQFRCGVCGASAESRDLGTLFRADVKSLRRSFDSLRSLRMTTQVVLKENN